MLLLLFFFLGSEKESGRRYFIGLEMHANQTFYEVYKFSEAQVHRNLPLHLVVKTILYHNLHMPASCLLIFEHLCRKKNYNEKGKGQENETRKGTKKRT